MKWRIRKISMEAPVQIMNLEKNVVSDLLPLTYPTGRANQFWICSIMPQVIWMRMVANRTISMIFTSGNVAMK
jgi:hypothetical protein